MSRNREFGILVTVTFVLLFFGLTMAYSASAPVGQKVMGDDYYYFKKMLFFVIVGLIAMFLVASVRYETWTRFWPIFYGASFVGLLLVFTSMGLSAGEATRSIRIGPITVQPSEFARLAVVFFLASFCARQAERLKDLKKGFLPAMVGVSVLTAMILAGRDLGIPVTIGMTTLFLIYIAGAKIKHIAATAGIGVVSLGLLIAIEPYRIQRLLVFIDPWRDPKDGGWQIIQSLAALGSGGAFGVGPGRGLQKYLYLPAAHTDFVFSIIGEEMGLFGTMIINLAFITLAVVGFRIAMKAVNREASFLALGISFMICATALINMGVAVDLLPTKGITLPLVSYGGSSLLTNMIAIGILMNIARTSTTQEILQPVSALGGGATV